MDSMKQKYDHCVQHVGQNVHVQMFDEKTFQGFLESVDDEHVYLLVPENVADGEEVAAAYIHHGGQGHHHHGGQGHHHGGHHHHGGQGHHHGGHHHQGTIMYMEHDEHNHHMSQGHQSQSNESMQNWMNEHYPAHAHENMRFTPEGSHQQDARIFGGFGPGFGYGYGPGPFYGGGRFRRIALPLAGLAALSLIF